MSSSSTASTRRTLSAMAGDLRSLGPSDSSDSGSDAIGQERSVDPDLTAPVDVVTRPDGRRPGQSIESPGGGTDTDAAGTGERRSAGNDAGAREASDIGPDRIDAPSDDRADPDLAAEEALRRGSDDAAP